jgi:hypothetical protein
MQLQSEFALHEIKGLCAESTIFHAQICQI